jgi:predicted DNA-binding protein with PD1-like motif
MTEFISVAAKEIIMGKLSHGCDLLEELTNIAIKRGVKLGRIEAIGAVKKAHIGFYHQDIQEYHFKSFDQPLEITKLVGNISLKDDQPFVHAHITLADDSGKSFGGHLAPGTIVFACEFILEIFDGPALNRSLDQETGLLLWSI